MSDEKESVSKESSALVEKKSTELVDSGDFAFDTDNSHSDFGQNDFSVPFLSIVQALSKAKQKNHAKYVAGADEGNVLNSATRIVYDVEKTPLIVVPFVFQHRYIAWKPNNGGIAYDMGNDSSTYDSIQPDPNNKGKRLDPDGNELVDAMEYFVLLVDPETGHYEMAVLPMSGIFAKKGRQWNNLIRNKAEVVNGKSVRPPIYYYAYQIITKPESNDKGSWYSWDITDFGKVPDLKGGKEIFQVCKETRSQVTSGILKAAVDTEAVQSDEDSDDTNAF